MVKTQRFLERTLFVYFLILTAGKNYAQCSADFSLASNSCQYEIVSFNYTGNAGQPNFYWDFGDVFSNNNTDSIANPFHRFERAGTFTVTLIVADTGGCIDTISKTIRVLKKPIASFSVSQTCAGLGTQFNNSSIADSSDSFRDFLWLFGDGGNDYQYHPQHNYTSAGNKTVTLTANTWNGCKDTFIYTVIIFDSISLTINKDTACKGDFITFSMNPGTGLPGTYQWTFGDGSGTYSQTTSHQYNSSGTFTPSATLYYSNNTICTKTGKPITIHALPDASFSLLDSIQCFKYNSVCLKAKIPPSGLLFRSISYDDGFVDNTSPLTDSIFCYSYTDTSGGRYSLSMDIIDLNGCLASYTLPSKLLIYPEIEAFFNSSKVTGCFQTPFFASNASNMSPPKVTGFLWDFGDGSTDAANWNSTSHTYTTDGQFDISLIIQNSDGCSDTFTRDNWVTNISFPADARMDSALSLCRSSNTFQFRQTSISGGQIYWDFGNLDTSFIFNPDYHYPNTGMYFPKVQISKNGCLKIIDLDTIFVYGPMASIGNIVNQFQCSIRDTVILNNTSVYFKNRSLKFFWDVGDIYASACISDSMNNSNVGINCRYSVDSTYIRHMFSPGQEACYFPKLIVTDTVIGCSDTAIANLPLNRPDATSGLKLITRNLCLGPEPEKTVELDLSLTKPGCGQEKFWVMWDSTCASKSSDFNANWKPGETKHNYSYNICDSSGKISIGLILQNGTDSNNTSCSDTAWYHDILDYGRVNPKFSSTYAPGQHYCKNTAFTFNITDTKQDSLTLIHWEWGDGYSQTVGSIAPISHTYTKAGIYNVVLTLGLKNGCGASDTLQVKVGYSSFFNVSDNEICLGKTVNLNKNINYWNGAGSFWNDSNRTLAGLESVKWDYGVGTGFSSTILNPKVIYQAIGDYNIRLAITDSIGCKDTFTLLRAVRVFGIKTLFTTLKDTFTCAQLISFKSDVTVYDSVNMFGHPDDKVNKYSWIFGTGLSNSILKNPTKFLKAGNYNVKLIAENTRQCLDSFNKSITILGPIASFNFARDSTGCQALKVSMKNLSTFSTSYTWNFGDAFNSSQFTTSDSNMSFSYPQYGSFYPKLTAFITLISNGIPVTCSNTFPDTSLHAPFRRITVFENPKPQFSYITNCNSLQTAFTNLSFINKDTIVRYSWDFGDGDTSDLKNPSHQFADTGRYWVRLKAYSGLGCSGEISQLIIISPFPVVWFQKTDVCLGMSIHFKDSTEAFNDRVKLWVWNFDDGTVSVLKNPVKTYAYDSIFKVSLTVTNYAGCTSSDTISVKVHSRPNTNFTFVNQCFSENIPLNNTTTSKENPLKYYWTFGDGDTSTKISINKFYDSTGNYNVKLKAVNGFGCDDSIAKTVTSYPLPLADFVINSHEKCRSGNQFLFTNNSSTDTGSLFYLWNYGDSNSSALVNPVKSYQKAGRFQIALMAITHYNCRDTAFDTLLINPNPVTQLYLSSPATQCINTNLFTFIDSSTILSGSFTRKWDLGDFTFSTDSTISHKYMDTGNYLGRLTTLSDKNCPDTIPISIRINPKPRANFSVNQPVQCQNINHFVLTNTSAGYYGNTTSRWYFGDGDSSLSLQGIHHYNSYDTFTIKLIATNSTQCLDTTTQTVLVPPIPNPMFEVIDSLPCERNNLFMFLNKSTIPFGMVQYKWEYGDLRTDSTYNASNSYDTFGTYTVRLVAMSNNGCSDTTEHDIEVFPMPFPAFTVNDQSQCRNAQNFIFTNKSSIALDSFDSRWILGENDTVYTIDAQKQFTADGSFRISLQVNSHKGCMDSMAMFTIVHPQPFPVFTVNDSTQCINSQSFVFGNISSINKGSMTYQWNFGDGNTDTVNSLFYRYSTHGNYNVTLRTVSDSGCLDSVTKHMEVFPKPTCSVSVNDSSQCINTNLFFFHANTGIPYGLVDQYYWNLDSSAFSSGPADTSIRYNTVGLRGIRLIVESLELCRDTSHLEITTDPKPKAQFIVNDTAQCLSGNLFVFTNLSTTAIGTLKYKWDFGNGDNDSSVSPQKSFNTYDSLKVRLIPYSIHQCSDTFISAIIIFPQPQPSFYVNDSDQCLRGNRYLMTNMSSIPSGSMTYTWETGDGISFNNPDTGYVYHAHGTYKIILRALSSEDCVDSISKFNTLHPQPISDFSVNKVRQCLNDQLFIFTNKSSIAYGNLIYQWKFGDGVVSDSISVNHQYAQFGVKTIELKVSSEKLCSDSSNKTVRVLAKPEMSFNINNSNQCVNIQKLLFNSTATIPEGNITNYYWDFDEGTKDSGKSVSHYFDYSRYYTITHTAVSDSLCVDSVKRVIRIFPKPIARFSINDSAQCLRNNAYIFTDMSYDSFGISKLDWDLSEGIKANSSITNHKYTDTGYKSLKLIVTSVNGCMDTVIRQIYLKRMPDPNFAKLAPYYCQNSPLVNLVPSESGGTFSGKNAGNYFYNPLVLWKDTVKYEITVNGCYDSSVQYTHTFPPPDIHLGNDTQLCLFEYLDLNANFWNSTYKWGNSSVTDSILTVIRNGTYIVTVSNICGVDSDTIIVTYTNHNCRFFMPNAFSPNDDDHNDFFKPYTVNVPDMSMQIYNRWGEKVFEGNQDSPGWDGKYLGEPVQQDVYIWVVFYRYPLENKWIQIKEKGTMQLLR